MFDFGSIFTAAGLATLGITYASDEAHTLPMLNAIWIPKGVDDMTIRRTLCRHDSP